MLTVAGGTWKGARGQGLRFGILNLGPSEADLGAGIQCQWFVTKVRSAD